MKWFLWFKGLEQEQMIRNFDLIRDFLKDQLTDCNLNIRCIEPNIFSHWWEISIFSKRHDLQRIYIRPCSPFNLASSNLASSKIKIGPNKQDITKIIIINLYEPDSLDKLKEVVLMRFQPGTELWPDWQSK